MMIMRLAQMVFLQDVSRGAWRSSTAELADATT
jgi:hypothetical protein